MPEELIGDVCQAIFDFDEIMFEEVKSAGYLATLLEEEGFQVERNVAGLPTAFIARYDFSDEGPTLGLMAEYDSLPGLGHACGHNLIAGAAVGAAIGLKNADLPLTGSLVLFGTPAEEGGGGKVIMADAGCFDEIDGMVYFHPSVRDDLYGPTLACRIYQVIVNGKPAHVQLNPQDGRNALEALIQVFGAMRNLDEKYGDKVRNGGIIKEGGHQSILVPSKAEGEIWLSGVDDDTLAELSHDFLNAVKEIAEKTETEIEMEEAMHYSSVIQNQRINKIIEEEMVYLGLEPAPPSLLMTSTDCGAPSKKCPFAGFRLSMGDPSPVPHTHQFTEASGSQLGVEKAVIAARISGLALLNLYMQPELLSAIKAEFEDNCK